MDLSKLTDNALADKRLHPRGLWVEGKYERLPKRPLTLRRGRQHLLGLRHGRAKRLLAEHHLARTESRHGPLRMQRVRQRNIDDVHGGIVQDRLIALHAASHAILSGESLSDLRGAAAHHRGLGVTRLA